MNTKQLSFLIIVIIVVAFVFYNFSSIGEGEENFATSNDLKSLSERVDKLDRSIPPVIELGMAAGWIVKFDNGVTVYNTGDTGLDINYNMIKEYYQPDIIITSNSKLYQIGPEEIAWLMTKINPEFVLPSHHGSFPFYPVDAKELTEEVAKRRLAGQTRTAVIDPKIGETFELKGLKFTWLGHASYVIESPNNSRIIFDPEWTAVNSDFPVSYRDPSQKGAFDLILVTHAHFDHFDLKAISELMKESVDRKPMLAGIFELVAYTQKFVTESSKRMAPMNYGVWASKQDFKDAYAIEATHLDDIEIAAVWASHSSGVAR